MTEYIEREALQAALVRKRCGVANQRYTEGWNDCLLRVKSMVSKAPRRRRCAGGAWAVDSAALEKQ